MWAKGKRVYEEFTDHIISATLNVNRNYTQMPFLYLIKVFNNWTLSQVPLTNTYVKTRHRNLKTENYFYIGREKGENRIIYTQMPQL